MSSYKFRILIDTDTQGDIFRDIIINPTDNFEVFYRAIIASFDFIGKELASFYVSNDNWDKGHEIALMDMGLGNALDAPFIMRDTPISTMVRTKGQKLVLVYDFLKMWCFLIELVEILPEEFVEPELYYSMGIAPHEDSREIDLANTMGMGQNPDLGNEIDDIFSEFNEDEEGFGSFENIDDFDI